MRSGQDDEKQFTSEYFDEKQYTRKGIAKYETIFGRNFISTGGQRSAKEFLGRLGLKPGMRILDIGCGIGGHAFQMVKDYAVRVDGIDISRNMIAIARERCKEADMESQVRLIHGDIFETQFDATFDVIHSRDAFLHIHENTACFRSFTGCCGLQVCWRSPITAAGTEKRAGSSRST